MDEIKHGIVRELINLFEKGSITTEHDHINLEYKNFHKEVNYYLLQRKYFDLWKIYVRKNR